jgi:hypothetical protein
MSMFNSSDDDHETSNEGTMFHRREDEQEEAEDSNMFSRGKKSEPSLLEWLCNPVWTSNLED